MLTLNKRVQFFLILIAGILSTETFAQKSFENTANDGQIQLPIIKVGLSGHILATGKYDLSVKTLKNLNLNLYYGNRSLDYLHLASTANERWYGAGVEYYFGRFGNTFFSGTINIYNRAEKDQHHIPYRRLFLTTPLLGVTGIDKGSGLYYHVKAGWGNFSKSLDKRSDQSYFKNGLSLDVGVGIAFGIKKKVYHN